MDFNFQIIRNNKYSIAISVVAVALHIAMVFAVKDDYQNRILIEKQKPYHFSIQNILSLNLRTKCDYEDEALHEELNKLAVSKGLKVTIASERVGQIDSLILKKIFLTSTSLKNPELVVTTDGLILESGDNCYGLI